MAEENQVEPQGEAVQPPSRAQQVQQTQRK